MTNDPDFNMASETYKELIEENLIYPATPAEHAAKWMAQEDRGLYRIGCPDRSGRRAMILAVETAGAIASMDYARARGLIRKLEENTEDAEHAASWDPWNS